MRSFILIKAFLLCSYRSESQTVQVQPGEEITPLCPNISTTPTQTDWLRLVNRTKSSCVSSLYESEGSPSFCHGFQNGKYEMSSNVSTVFLKIKHVDLSDSGLYFCGFYIKKHTVIAEVIELSIKTDCKAIISILDESDGRINLITVILGSLTVLLTIVIVGLAVKIRKLQTASHFLENKQNRGPDHLNYAALSFQAKPKRNRRPASERQLEPNVVYAATR
uniref:Immunoglobulin domain-containing protein n=1 Tax=Mastacembelus armatus TaxID=205130 RepID=A0A3Q3LEM7_9TELE